MDQTGVRPVRKGARGSIRFLESILLLRLHCRLVRLPWTRNRGLVSCTWHYLHRRVHMVRIWHHACIQQDRVEFRTIFCKYIFFPVVPTHNNRSHPTSCCVEICAWNAAGRLRRRALQGERTNKRRFEQEGVNAKRGSRCTRTHRRLLPGKEHFAVAGLNFYGARNGHVVSSSARISTFRWFEWALVQARRGERPRLKCFTAFVHWRVCVWVLALSRQASS